MIPFFSQENPQKTHIHIILFIVGCIELTLSTILISSIFHNYDLRTFYTFLMSNETILIKIWSIHALIMIFYSLLLIYEKKIHGCIQPKNIFIGEFLLWCILFIFVYFMYSLRGITSLG